MNKNLKNIGLAVAGGLLVAGINMGAHYVVTKYALEHVFDKRIEKSYCPTMSSDSIPQYDSLPYLKIGNDSVKMYE